MTSCQVTHRTTRVARKSSGGTIEVVTFRDDHDAALARADALERERDDAKETAEQAEAKLAAANAERLRLEAEVAELRARQPADEAKPPAIAPPPSSRLWVWVGVVVVAVAFLVVIVAKSKRTNTIPNPTCTLVTVPSGATIVAIRRNRVMSELSPGRTLETSTYEMTIGVTPLSMARMDWIVESVIDSPRLEARLAGYKPMSVSMPLEGMGCSSQQYLLERFSQ